MSATATRVENAGKIFELFFPFFVFFLYGPLLKICLLISRSRAHNRNVFRSPTEYSYLPFIAHASQVVEFIACSTKTLSFAQTSTYCFLGCCIGLRTDTHFCTLIPPVPEPSKLNLSKYRITRMIAPPPWITHTPWVSPGGILFVLFFYRHFYHSGYVRYHHPLRKHTGW